MTAISTDLPASVTSMIDVPLYEEEGEFPVERGYIWTTCSSVENGNPLFWDEAVADEITGGNIAPPTMLSVWFRPHHWAPDRSEPHLPLQVHFDLKERLGLPEAVMTSNTMVFHDPVRPGDRLLTQQVLKSVSPEKTTKLGTGRFWVIDVEYHNQSGALVGVESYTGFGYRRAPSTPGGSSPDPREDRAVGSASGGPPPGATAPGPSPYGPPARQVTTSRLNVAGDIQKDSQLPILRYEVTATTVVLGALASRDWRPMHHDKDFAVERNGLRDIFLNTPNQAAWFERYVTDWSGPYGRLGRMTFTMKGSVFPGDTMEFTGRVEGVETDQAGCAWATLAIQLAVAGEEKTTCAVRIALPVAADDNPWRRRGDNWKP